MEKEVEISEGTEFVRNTDRDGNAYLPSAYPSADGEGTEREKGVEVQVEEEEEDLEEECDIVLIEQRRHKTPRSNTVSGGRETEEQRSREIRTAEAESELDQRKDELRERNITVQETRESRSSEERQFEKRVKDSQDEKYDIEEQERQTRTTRDTSDINTSKDHSDKDRENVNNPPVSVPRRSTRQKRPPDRYGDVVSYQMVRPVDSRVTKLDSLIKSGVFCDLDQEAMNIVMSAVIK